MSRGTLLTMVNGSMDRAAGAAVSSGECSGVFAGRPFDLHAVRRAFPARWSEFLRAHFSGPVHVAFIFGVDERTARNWWDGVGSPRAEVALLAVARLPGGADLLRVAA